jgi:hypothetical protein
MGVGGQCHAPAALPRERNAVPILWEGGWVLGPVWTGSRNLDSTVIRFTDRPARGESLYGMMYDLFFVKLLIMTSCVMK